MPCDTENALTFMDHHHKMYQCLPANPSNSNFPDYMYYLDIGSKVPGIIEDLSACVCCERHQMNRPTTLMDSTDLARNDSVNPFITPWPPIHMTHKNQPAPEQGNCDCRCRSYSRHLCIAYRE